MLELTFYRLQAHFFSKNAEVIHGRVAVVCLPAESGEQSRGRPRAGWPASDETRTGIGSGGRRSCLILRAEWV